MINALADNQTRPQTCSGSSQHTTMREQVLRSGSRRKDFVRLMSRLGSFLGFAQSGWPALSAGHLPEGGVCRVSDLLHARALTLLHSFLRQPSHPLPFVEAFVSFVGLPLVAVRGACCRLVAPPPMACGTPQTRGRGLVVSGNTGSVLAGLSLTWKSVFAHLWHLGP